LSAVGRLQPGQQVGHIRPIFGQYYGAPVSGGWRSCPSRTWTAGTSPCGSELPAV